MLIILESYLRTTMKDDRLGGLALMHINKHGESLNSQDIVDDFAASGSRRKELLLDWQDKKLPF